MQNKVDLLRLPEGELWLSGRVLRLAEENTQGVVRNNFPLLDVDLDAPIDWDADPQKNVTWRLYYCCMGWVAPFAKAGHNRQELADFAKRAVMSAAQYALDHDVVDNKGFWNDHATAYRGSYIAYIYAEILEGRLTPEEQDLLDAAMAKHKDILIGFLDSDKWLFSNHTLFHAEGLADIVLTFEADEDLRMQGLKQVARYVSEFANRVITVEEGSVKEHAMFYHAFLMGRLRLTSEYLAKMGVKQTIVAERTYRRMKAFLYRVMPLNGVLPGVGDSKHQQKFDKKYIRQFRAMKFDSPETDHYREDDTLAEFLNSRPDYLAAYPTDGYYVARSYSNTELYSLFLHKAFKGPHGHWDALSFIAYHKGQPIFIDSGGPYKYGDQMRYRYFQTQLAHNSLIQEGTVSRYHSKMLLVDQDSDSAVLVGGTRLTKSLYWVRAFVQVADLAHVIVDWPISDGAEQAPITARFHIDPKLELERTGDSVLISSGEKPVAQMTSQTADAPSASAMVAALSELEFEAQKPLSGDRLKALPENYDKRSFVTYTDNKYEEGQLVDLPVQCDQLNLRTVLYDDTASVACVPDGAELTIEVQANAYCKRIRIDLSAMAVTLKETRHG